MQIGKCLKDIPFDKIYVGMTAVTVHNDIKAFGKVIAIKKSNGSMYFHGNGKFSDGKLYFKEPDTEMIVVDYDNGPLISDFKNKMDYVFFCEK